MRRATGLKNLCALNSNLSPSASSWSPGRDDDDDDDDDDFYIIRPRSQTI